MARVRRPESLGSWLYGVASRKSLKISSARHRKPTGEFPSEVPVNHDPLAHLAQRCEERTLDEEIAGLPEKYRSPLVLHYFLGKTCGEIANRLGLSLTAVEGRLKR